MENSLTRESCDAQRVGGHQRWCAASQGWLGFAAGVQSIHRGRERIVMERANKSRYGFAVLLVAIAALVHTWFTGSYIVDPHGYQRTFWIGPVSTTLPFAFLALAFLVHSERLRRVHRDAASFARPAYWGASAAWLAMMAFTAYLIGQTPGPKTSSTMAIALFMTPFCYLPFLVVAYPCGAIAGSLWSKWKNAKRVATA
jgi:hypothetical protein